MFGVFNCGSETALLVGISAEVAEKKNIEPRGRITLKKGGLKEQRVLFVFWRDHYFSRLYYPHLVPFL